MIARIVAAWCDRISEWARRSVARAWQRKMRKAFPIGSLVSCCCARCHGKVWQVYQYDYDTRDLRVVTPEAAAEHGDMATAWDKGTASECTWISPEVLTVVVRMPNIAI